MHNHIEADNSILENRLRKAINEGKLDVVQTLLKEKSIIENFDMALLHFAISRLGFHENLLQKRKL